MKRASLCGIFLLQLALGISTSHAQQSGQDALKIVDNPGGGQFVYGSLLGQTDRAKAMAFMLQKVHGHFGDRPQVGKLFQSKDGSQIAAFFTLTDKNKSGKPLAGLVIVTMAAGKTPQAAVMYDEVKRFPSTEPVMLKSISAASGRPTGEASTQQAPALASKGGVESLHTVTAGDQSASIGLPNGWWLTGVSGGQLTAEGPNGEMVGLGLIYQNIIDPRSPQAQMWMNRPLQGGGAPIVCALGGDLFTAFGTVLNQVRRNSHKGPATLRLISAQNLPGEGGPIHPIQAIYTIDLNDGKGPRKASARIGVMPGARGALWAMTVSTSNIPEALADAENPTLMAVIKSYRQNSQVIAREGAADVARIQAIGERIKIQTAAENERRESSNKAYEQHRQDLNANSNTFDQHMGDIDWSSKVTQDYILDRSVVRDTDDDAHGTFSNKFADFLVKSYPNQFEIVPNQQMIRGLDY